MKLLLRPPPTAGPGGPSVPERRSSQQRAAAAARQRPGRTLGCPPLPVAVVTDTTSYLPAELVQANQIHLVSLYVVFGGERTVREADITDYDAFFDELRGTEKLPTTSQPSIGDFIAVWEPLLARGDDVVSIHISGGISGTVQSAQQAAEQLERDGKGGERVRVIDSATSAGGLGLVALAAARAAAGGAELEDVVARATDARE